MPRYDERTAECRVYTYKEGLLSPMAHDLTIAVGRFWVEVADGITAELDATSLRVLGPPVLSAADRREIESRIAGDVLQARRFPTIAFQGTFGMNVHSKSARITGTLTLHGHSRPLAFDATQDAGRWRARVRLHQPEFGIRPYSALLGTLRIRPDVDVEIALPV